MDDKAKAKGGKKEGAVSDEAAQVTVTFTVSFTATRSPIPPPPCFVYDHRFSFCLFASPVISPPVGTWSPAPAVDPSALCDASAAVLTWSSSMDMAIGREQLLAMERDVVTFSMEQRQARVEEEKDGEASEDVVSASKAAKLKASAPLPAKKKREGEEEHKSVAHPALTGELPFTPQSSFLLPLSALLCAPHEAAFTAPSNTSFALPEGLSSLTCTLHTNNVNPIHPGLLPALLPISISLHSLSPLTVPAHSPSPYRPLSLSLSLPCQPVIPLTSTFHHTSSLSLSSLPPRTVFLGVLPRAVLWSLGSDRRAGIRVEVRDRDDGRILTKEEAQEEEAARQRRAEDARMAEEQRLKDEEKKKKKQPTKSPMAKSKKEGLPSPPPVEVAPAPVPSANGPPPIVYDARSNVYGVATVPLHDLFSLSSSSSIANVLPVYPDPSIPLLPPTTRSNPYPFTFLSYTVKLLHPLPELRVLKGDLPYGRVVAVMEEAESSNVWSAVYEEVLKWNAKACGVDNGLKEGDGSWDWLDTVKGGQDVPAAGLGEEEEKAAEKESFAAKVTEKALKTARKGKGKPEEKVKEEPPPGEVVPAAPAPLLPSADHLTGAFITDGKQRWLILEGLSPCRPNGAALSAVQQRLVEAKRRGLKLRLLIDNELAFSSRLYPDCPLSLLHLKLAAPVNSLVGKASSLSSSSASFLALSKLSMLAKSSMVKGLKHAWDGRVMLEEAEVRELQQRWSTAEKLKDVYGAELGQRERDARKAKKAKYEELERQREELNNTEPPAAPVTEQSPPQEQAVAAPQPVEAAPIPPSVDQPAVPNNAASVEFTVIAPSAASAKPSPARQPQSAPSALALLPSLTYSTAAEYRACLRTLREACHSDSQHHYTFHPSYLHSSIPRWEDAEEAAREERKQQRAKWTDPKGFNVAGHALKHGLFSSTSLLSDGERRMEREERRRQKTIDERVDERWAAKCEQLHKQREKQFYTQPVFPSLFDRSPPTSVHLSSAAEGAAQKAFAAQAAREWQSKVIVDDPAFHVLWRGQQHPLRKGYSRLFAISEGLRKDEPNKKALKFEREGEEKSLVVQVAPVSIVNEGAWECPAQRAFREEKTVDGQLDFIRFHFSHSFIHRPQVRKG